MNADQPDSSPVPQPATSVDPDLSIKISPGNAPGSIEVAISQEETEATRFSSFSLNSANSISAPEIGESQNLLITDVAESIHVAKTAKSTAAKAAESNLRFWVTVVGLGFVLLVAVSDWRSQDGPPIPFPSTSKIPQIR